jgi:hypothetical protein
MCLKWLWKNPDEAGHAPADRRNPDWQNTANGLLTGDDPSFVTHHKPAPFQARCPACNIQFAASGGCKLGSPKQAADTMPRI